MLMMVILVGVMLGALLVPVIVSQNRSTRFDTSRVHALDAAQAGIDAAVGQIRSAVVNGLGDSSKLPCATTDAPIKGLTNSSGVAAYSVTIDYYATGTVTAPTSPMICVDGHGTYDPTPPGSVTPIFAVLTSNGTDGPAANGSTHGRTLTSTYVFQTSNANISGGTIRIYPADKDTANYCLDVGASPPVVGTVVGLQQCSTAKPLAPQQKFAYRNDLTMQLVSSIGPTYPNGLCLDAQTLGSTEPQTDTLLVLKQCATVGNPTWSQQWSVDQHRSIQAPQKTSASTGNLSGLCMTVTLVRVSGNNVHAADSSVTLSNCTGSLTSPTDAWVPSPAIGAGAAVNATSNQWINFRQFGRCLDAPNNDPNAPYMTAPGCRQNPDPTAPEYENQLLTLQPAGGEAVLHEPRWDRLLPVQPGQCRVDEPAGPSSTDDAVQHAPWCHHRADAMDAHNARHRPEPAVFASVPFPGL